MFIQGPKTSDISIIFISENPLYRVEIGASLPIYSVKTIYKERTCRRHNLVLEMKNNKFVFEQ